MFNRVLCTAVLLISLSHAKAEEVVVLDGESGMTDTQKSETAPVPATNKAPDSNQDYHDGKLILNDQAQLGGQKEGTSAAPLVAPVKEAVSEAATEISSVQSVTSSEKTEEIQQTKSAPVIINSLGTNRSFSQTYLQLYSGRLNTNLKKVSPSLNEGVDLFGFGVAIENNENWQRIVTVEIGQKKNEKNSSKNIIFYQFKVGAEFSALLNQSYRLKLLGHTALSFGDYHLRSNSNETQNTGSFTEYSQGTLLGFQPGIGLRFPIGNFFHLDTLYVRPFYFGKSRKNLSGSEYLARFSIPL